jgi:HPt (histidine-containing phosphotransfer) domain-containing protein
MTMTGNAATTYAHFDWPALVAKLGGDEVFARALLGVAQRSSAAMPADLRAAAAGTEFDAMARLAHKVKGTAGDICANQLRAVASAAEQAARQGSPESPARLRDVADHLDGLLRDLESVAAAAS